MSETVHTSIEKIQNGAVYAGHPDFSSLQAAIDFAEKRTDFDKIIVPPGTHGAIDPFDGQEIVGLSGSLGEAVVIDGGTSAHAVNLAATNNTTIRNLTLRTTSGGGSSFNCVQVGGGAGNRIVDCFLRESDNHGVYVGSGNDNAVRGCRATGGVDGTPIVFDSNSARNAAVGNTTVAPVTDNGSGNATAGNT